MDNVKAFHKQLKSIYEGKPPVSKAKMAFITKAAFKAIKFYKHIVLEVEKFALKAPAEYKLAALYVIDSIVRQSRHQNGHENDVFGPRFAKNFKQTFTNILQCNVEDKSKVVKVLNLWQKNGTFPTELVQMLLDLSNPNNSDMKLSDATENGSIKKSQKEFAEEALKVVDDLLEKCGKDPQGMGINPQHYQQLEIIGRYLKQQLDNKNHKLDGSDGNSITVDAKVVTQLRELAAQLFGKVNNSNDHQSIASKIDKTKQNTPINDGAKKDHTLLKDVNNDAALTGFNKKLLDFDYGDEDDDSPGYNNHSITSKANIPNANTNFSLPPIDPTIKEAAQKIFNDPGIMRELQNMTPLMCDGGKYSDDLRKQILAQQQEEFDKEIQNSVKSATHQFQYIPGLSPQQNTFSASSFSNTYAMNHLKNLNFISSSSINPNFTPFIPSNNLKDVPLPSLPCPFPAYNKNSLSNFNSFPTTTTKLPSLMDDQTDYLRYKSITQVDGDYRALDHDERHPTKKSNDVGSKDHRRSSASKDREYRGAKRDRGGRDSDRNNGKSSGGRDYDNDKTSDKRTRHKDSTPTNNTKRGNERDDRDRRGKDSGGSKKRSRGDSSDRKETNSQQHKSSSNNPTYHGSVAHKSDCITVLSRTLWIGRVPKNSTENDLKQAFKEYNVTADSFQMVPPRGCAYVTFNTRHDAAKILDRMKDKYKLFGKTLQVNWSPFKGLKDRKTLKQYWSESLGVYYLPYDKVEINMVNDYNDGGIVEWDSVPSNLRANMQAELMKHHRNEEPPLNLHTLSDFPNKNANPQPFPNFNVSLSAPLPASIPLPAQISPNFEPTSLLHDAGQQNLANPPLQRPLPYSNMNYPAQRFPLLQIPPPPNVAQPRGPYPPSNFNRFPRFPFNNSEPLASSEPEQFPDRAGPFSNDTLTSAQAENVQNVQQYNGQFAVGPNQLLMAQRQQRLMLQQRMAAQQLQNAGASSMNTHYAGNQQFMQQRFAQQAQHQRPFFPGFRPNPPQMAQMMRAGASGLNPLFLAGLQNAMRARLMMAGGQGGFNIASNIGQQQYLFAQSNNVARGSDQARQGWNEGIGKFEGDDHPSYGEGSNFEELDDSPLAVPMHSAQDLHERETREDKDWSYEKPPLSPNSTLKHVEPSLDAMKSIGDTPGLDGAIAEPINLENEVVKEISEDVVNMIDTTSDQKEVVFEDPQGHESIVYNSKEHLDNSQQSNVDIEGDV